MISIRHTWSGVIAQKMQQFVALGAGEVYPMIWRHFDVRFCPIYTDCLPPLCDFRDETTRQVNSNTGEDERDWNILKRWIDDWFTKSPTRIAMFQYLCSLHHLLFSRLLLERANLNYRYNLSRTSFTLCHDHLVQILRNNFWPVFEFQVVRTVMDQKWVP